MHGIESNNIELYHVWLKTANLTGKITYHNI